MLSSTQRKLLRQEKILLALSTLRFATREQLQSIPDLGLGGTDRNALKVLNEMKELVACKNHLGRNVYYLTKKGGEVIGIEDVPQWSLQLEHHLLRNDVYIHYGCPKDWKVEGKIELKPSIGDVKYIRPDAVWAVDGVYHFLEVDRTQSMVENKKKIEAYASVNHLIQSKYHAYPILLFYTTTPIRRETLTKFCHEKQLNFHILTKEDLA